MSKRLLTCAVCGRTLASTEAYQVGYSLVGWPAVVPVSVVVCRSGSCCGEWDGRVAARGGMVSTDAGRQMSLLEAA